MSNKRSADSKEQNTSTPQSRASRAGRSPTSASTLEVPFALTSDGSLLVNVSSFEDSDLEGRPLFIGALLTDEELRAAKERLDNAAHELKSAMVGRLRQRRQATAKPDKE